MEDPANWNQLLCRLGLDGAEHRITAPEIKNTLRRNTDEAVRLEVFGVPSFVVDRELFWSFDATDMLLDYLQNPDLFNDPEMVRISSLPEGARRK